MWTTPAGWADASFPLTAANFSPASIESLPITSALASEKVAQSLP